MSNHYPQHTPGEQYEALREEVLGYSPFSMVRGQIQLHFPPAVMPGDLRPNDADDFGYKIRIARLDVGRISSHSFPDADKQPLLSELERLQELFPAPPTNLERDMERLKKAAGFVGHLGKTAVHTLVSPTKKTISGALYSPRRAKSSGK